MRLKLLVLALLTLWPTVSRADGPQAPCHGQGDTVVCERGGFDTLVQKCVDARGEATKCAIRLEAVQKDLTETRDGLSKCVDALKPKAQVPLWRAMGPVVLGAVGGLAFAGSIAIDGSASSRFTGAAVGLALVGAGIVFAIP